MHIVYVLLSPTYGMHLYTADLAADMVNMGNTVHLVTTTTAPLRCYHPAVQVLMPVTTSGTGFSKEGMSPASVRSVHRTIVELQPDVVHFTGVHLWNIPLLELLRRDNIPLAHSLHDLDPHLGVKYAPLIRLWNRLVLGRADHILVHGQCYRERLLDQGLQPEQVTFLPLLHAFLEYPRSEDLKRQTPAVVYEPIILFFGRLLPYKGIPSLLLSAEHQIWNNKSAVDIVLAGPGELGYIWPGLLPEGVSVRNRLIRDDEGHDLFSCAALLVLPYVGATQSALISAAYAFAKPVIVTDSGALPEYVIPGETGWIVPSNDEVRLAETISAALADEDQLKGMGLAGRSRYEEQRAMQPGLLAALYQACCRTNRILTTRPARRQRMPGAAKNSPEVKP